MSSVTDSIADSGIERVSDWPADPDAPNVIVVGVDGSADSAEALRWALALAAHSGARVSAVQVWTPLPWYRQLPPRQQRRLSADRYRSADQAGQALRDTLTDVLTEAGPAGVVASVVEGAPGAALVDLSRDARMLVVGATGRGSAAADPAPPIGATARYVTRHATCPVTVVRRARRGAAPHRRTGPAVPVPVPAAR